MVHCLAGSSRMTDQSTKFVSSNISKVANYSLVSRKFSTYTVVLFPVQLLPFHGHAGSGRGGMERDYWAILYPMGSKTVQSEPKDGPYSKCSDILLQNKRFYKYRHNDYIIRLIT